MHAYQRRLDIIETIILGYFQELGFETCEDHEVPTAYGVEFNSHTRANLTELAVRVNEGSGVAT